MQHLFETTLHSVFSFCIVLFCFCFFFWNRRICEFASTIETDQIISNSIKYLVSAWWNSFELSLSKIRCACESTCFRQCFDGFHITQSSSQFQRFHFPFLFKLYYSVSRTFFHDNLAITSCADRLVEIFRRKSTDFGNDVMVTQFFFLFLARTIF